MKQTTQTAIISTMTSHQEISERMLKRAYSSPELVSLGDIRGVTMGSGSKSPDLDETDTLT